VTFLTGAATSQGIVRFTATPVNSLISIVIETSVFLTIFGILFYLDNKHRFANVSLGSPILSSEVIRD
jgi:hypothetical protein